MQFYTVAKFKNTGKIKVIGYAKDFAKLVDNYIFGKGLTVVRESDEFAEFEDRLVYTRSFPRARIEEDED